MCNELEIKWKEAVVTYFKVLSWHLPGGTKENPRKLSFRIAGLRAEKNSLITHAPKSRTNVKSEGHIQHRAQES
jgi:hypothetical protein